MRGALEPVDGVTKVEITEGEKPFKVTYDPNKVNVDDLLEKLAKAGETAEKKG